MSGRNLPDAQTNSWDGRSLESSQSADLGHFIVHVFNRIPASTQVERLNDIADDVFHLGTDACIAFLPASSLGQQTQETAAFGIGIQPSIDRCLTDAAVLGALEHSAFHVHVIGQKWGDNGVALFGNCPLFIRDSRQIKAACIHTPIFAFRPFQLSDRQQLGNARLDVLTKHMVEIHQQRDFVGLLVMAYKLTHLDLQGCPVQSMTLDLRSAHHGTSR
ncbi:hypothetical protein D9M71_319220 [compost metagenome]